MPVISTVITRFIYAYWLNVKRYFGEIAAANQVFSPAVLVEAPTYYYDVVESGIHFRAARFVKQFACHSQIWGRLLGLFSLSMYHNIVDVTTIIISLSSGTKA